MNGRNRRRKDVPFNPFAQNAAAERNRRHAEKAKEKRRIDSQNQNAAVSNNTDQKAAGKTLQDLQREAREKLAAEGSTADALNTPKQEITAIRKSTKAIKPEIKEITPTITQTTAAKPANVNNRYARGLLNFKGSHVNPKTTLNWPIQETVAKIHDETSSVDDGDNEQ